MTLFGLQNEDLKLSEGQIPAVGSKPAKGYTTGSWDPAPPTDQELITESKTYTYTYQLLPSDEITTDPQEKAITFTNRLYREILNREPENLGHDAWVNALASGKTGAVQLIIGFFCSPEYQSQNHTVEDTVCRLYRVILNREADAEGLAFWLAKLNDGTVSPDQLLGEFENSAEFKAIDKALKSE